MVLMISATAFAYDDGVLSEEEFIAIQYGIDAIIDPVMDEMGSGVQCSNSLAHSKKFKEVFGDPKNDNFVPAGNNKSRKYKTMVYGCVTTSSNKLAVVKVSGFLTKTKSDLKFHIESAKIQRNY